MQETDKTISFYYETKAKTKISNCGQWSIIETLWQKYREQLQQSPLIWTMQVCNNLIEFQKKAKYVWVVLKW